MGKLELFKKQQIYPGKEWHLLSLYESNKGPPGNIHNVY